MRRATFILLIVAGVVVLAITSRILGLWLQGMRGEDPTDGGDGGSGPGFVEGPIAAGITLASPRFVHVGQSFSIASLGNVLEAASAAETAGAISHQAEAQTVRCDAGGKGFVRAQYRSANEPANRVQTQLVVCVDETGPCAALPPVAFDLERFLERDPRGEADYLTQGAGSPFAACTAGDLLRVEPGPAMPPLMLRIIDALAPGVYAMSDEELDVVRRTSLRTLSGTDLRPSWFTQVSAELRTFEFNPDGSVTFTFTPCDESPTCTLGDNLARAGDLVSLGFGVPGNAGLEGYVASTDDATLAAFVESHLDIDWAATADLPPNARLQVLFRLAGLEVMQQVVDYFDDGLGLRASGSHIGYDPYWQTRSNVAPHCPGDRRADCDALDAALRAHERARIAELREAGYDLWHVAEAKTEDDGTYRPLAETAPPWDAFAGVGAILGLGRPVPDGSQRGDVVAAAVRGLAAEIGETPVIIDAHSSPMRFAVDGTFCEAEICPSAFGGLYHGYVPAVRAMLTEFSPGQVEGFAISTIDGGMHFDIREPYELRQNLWLNRVGETGFNNPLLNLYLTR